MYMGGLEHRGPNEKERRRAHDWFKADLLADLLTTPSPPFN